jgi:hypothetical protein
MIDESIHLSDRVRGQFAKDRAFPWQSMAEPLKGVIFETLSFWLLTAAKIPFFTMLSKMRH